MVKYLAFAACAAKAPVTQSLIKEIDDRVQIAGSPQNIERWMFWTVPQTTFLANATSQQKILLLGGNGVGKTILMVERAKQLALQGEEVIFCIDPSSLILLQKSMLQLQLEVEFEEFHKGNPQSKKIRVENLNLYDPFQENLNNIHVFIDELQSNHFQKYATLNTKSLWAIVIFDDDTKFKDANEAINYFKAQYPDWYIPFLNFILRTTQYIAEELKSLDRSDYQHKWNNESSLNHVLDIPQNIQEGHKPVIFDDETPNQFCKNLQSTLTKLGNNDVALIVLSFSIDCPVQSMSSKAINDFKTNFPTYSTLFSVDPTSIELTLAFIMQCIKISGREHPLIWTDDVKNFNSNEDQIKDWIRGKSRCDLIVDSALMPGFEASTCLTFTSEGIQCSLSRTRVKHILFKGVYDNVELP